MEALNPAQVREVEHIADLAAQQYFSNYLEHIWPVQQAAVNEAIRVAVTTHDSSKLAHGGVERKFSKYLWVFLGCLIGSSVGGAGLLELFQRLAG